MKSPYSGEFGEITFNLFEVQSSITSSTFNHKSILVPICSSSATFPVDPECERDGTHDRSNETKETACSIYTKSSVYRHLPQIGEQALMSCQLGPGVLLADEEQAV